MQQRRGMQLLITRSWCRTSAPLAGGNNNSKSCYFSSLCPAFQTHPLQHNTFLSVVLIGKELPKLAASRHNFREQQYHTRWPMMISSIDEHISDASASDDSMDAEAPCHNLSLHQLIPTCWNYHPPAFRLGCRQEDALACNGTATSPKFMMCHLTEQKWMPKSSASRLEGLESEASA